MTPDISVVIPTYNNEKTIHVALESIMNQTMSDIEIIVVDDNSTDGTSDVVHELKKKDERIIYYRLTPDDPEYNAYKYDGVGNNIDAGFSAVRYGWRRARSPWVTKQDADDFSLLNRLEIQLELATRYNVKHLVTGCFYADKKYQNKKFDLFLFERDFSLERYIIGSSELADMAREARGLLAGLPDILFRHIPFSLKNKKYIHKLFFNKLYPFPGAGNNPLIRTEIVKRIEGRERDIRRWPSLRGRGWDRDHNFRIALAYKSSIHIDVPLYGWHTSKPFDNYDYDISKYMI
ncbi:MAG TPA: hypothetical protein DCS29_00885 [Candidatus Magasanikbacteria bacterium]|nr:hypothetical protein [Candidatus Magasanikbacteria bacterium]